MYADLLLINNIRNAFAHSLHRTISFAHDSVKTDCQNLSYLHYLKSLHRHEAPIATASPTDVFVETVQEIYKTFKWTYDNKEAFMAAYRGVCRSWVSCISRPTHTLHHEVNLLGHLVVIRPARHRSNARLDHLRRDHDITLRMISDARRT